MSNEQQDEQVDAILAIADHHRADQEPLAAVAALRLIADLDLLYELTEIEKSQVFESATRLIVMGSDVLRVYTHGREQ